MSIIGSFNFRFVMLAALLGLFATTMYGFAAANTVDASKAGEGSGAISGYDVSGIEYTTSGSNVTAVSFLLDGAATTVSAQLDSTGGTWYNCADDGDADTTNGWTCNTTSPAIATADADSLSVSAAQ